MKGNRSTAGEWEIEGNAVTRTLESFDGVTTADKTLVWNSDRSAFTADPFNCIQDDRPDTSWTCEAAQRSVRRLDRLVAH